MKKGGKNSEKGDIMFDGSCGDRALRRIAGEEVFHTSLKGMLKIW